MERDEELKQLIQVFMQYRDLLDPIQANLKDFAESYQSVQADLNKLNNAFEGNVSGKLTQIMNSLQSQAEKASGLSSRIDQFVNETKRHTQSLENIISTFEKVENTVKNINQLENQAEAQLKKIEAIAEEKKKSYNVSQLQKSLESYNASLQNVSDYINKDVAKSVEGNLKKLEEIKSSQENAVKKINDSAQDVKTLVGEQQATNAFLKTIVEQNDVNESYLFDVLDKWAESRKVKIKKK